MASGKSATRDFSDAFYCWNLTFSKDIKVASFRVETLGEEFQNIKDEIEERLRAEAAKRR